MPVTIQRTLAGELKKSLKIKSLLILGPRQVGKTTLLRSLNPDFAINLADESVYRDHMKDPGLIKRQVLALGQSARVFIDEIQRIPSILNTVQSLIDANPELRFILTGSSARKLKRGQTNLLPGRIFAYRLYPLSWWEIREGFDLDKALLLGTLPEVYLNDYGVELIRNYIDMYLREEILAEAVVRGVEQFSRFLDISAEISGQEINYSQIASDSEIPKETLRRFYEILEDTLIVQSIPGYQIKSSKRKAVQKEKKIYFDMGVKNAVQKKYRNVLTDNEKGPLFEQWIINQMIAFANNHKLDWDFFYYRDDHKHEVDLVVDTGSKILAIEIKFARKTKAGFFTHLNFFREECAKPCEAFVVFRGDEKEKWGEVMAYPYPQFFEWLEIDYA